MRPLALDHIAVVGPTLDQAVDRIETALGVPMGMGGAHPDMGTYNRLLSLGGGVYLEAIAPDPGAPVPDRPRWFGLDEAPGEARLAAWIVRGGARDALPESLGPHERLTRGDLAWDITVRADGALAFDGAAPAHIDWGAGGTPAPGLPASGCRLLRLEVVHPEAHSLLAIWPALLTLRNVRIGPGPAPGLRAEILTPHGLRFLE